MFDPRMFILFNETYGPNASLYLVAGSVLAGFVLTAILVLTL